MTEGSQTVPHFVLLRCAHRNRQDPDQARLIDFERVRLVLAPLLGRLTAGFGEGQHRLRRVDLGKQCQPPSGVGYFIVHRAWRAQTGPSPETPSGIVPKFLLIISPAPEQAVYPCSSVLRTPSALSHGWILGVNLMPAFANGLMPPF
jgi:hypothetical protein